MNLIKYSRDRYEVDWYYRFVHLEEERKMSMEFYVYLKQEVPDKSGFEKYANDLGFQISVHPEVILMDSIGFCPIRFVDARFAEKDETDAFMTGFELYYDDFQAFKAATAVSKGFFGLFLKKQPKETPLDLAVKDSSVVISLRCSSVDYLEILMAYLFGAYCIKFCNAVFYDPQFGGFYTDSTVIENEISKIVDDLVEEKDAGNLQTHKFEKWL